MAATASACDVALYSIIADEAVLTLLSFLLGCLVLPRLAAWRAARSKGLALEASEDSEESEAEDCGAAADAAAVARQLQELRREVAAEAAKAVAMPLASAGDAATSDSSKSC